MNMSSGITGLCRVKRRIDELSSCAVYNRDVFGLSWCNTMSPSSVLMILYRFSIRKDCSAKLLLGVDCAWGICR